MNYKGSVTQSNMDKYFNNFNFNGDEIVFYFVSHGGIKEISEKKHYVFLGASGWEMTDAYIKDKLNGVIDYYTPGLIIFDTCSSGCLINSGHEWNLQGNNRVVITATNSFDPDYTNPAPTAYSWWKEWGTYGPSMAIFSHYLVNNLYKNNFAVEKAFLYDAIGPYHGAKYDTQMEVARLGKNGEYQTPAHYDSDVYNDFII